MAKSGTREFLPSIGYRDIDFLFCTRRLHTSFFSVLKIRLESIWQDSCHIVFFFWMKHMVTASSSNVLEKSIWQDSCHIDFLYISNILALWFGIVSVSSRLLFFSFLCSSGINWSVGIALYQFAAIMLTIHGIECAFRRPSSPNTPGCASWDGYLWWFRFANASRCDIVGWQSSFSFFLQDSFIT